MGSSRHPLALSLTAGLVVLFGCDAGEPTLPDPEPTPFETGHAGADANDAGAFPDRGDSQPAEPTDQPAITPEPTPTEPAHPVSLPALFDTTFTGRDLAIEQALETNPNYTRYAITYTSDDLTISGIMNVPTSDGPFPVLILAHGYIDPGIYTSGRGLAREQDYLARQGYAVLHTDYRNHAGSDSDPDTDLEFRLGYTADVINAVLAVRESSLPELDGERIGLLGRSMGGGVVYNALVTAPGLVDAAVVYAPVSSDAEDNFEQWTRGQPVGDEILAAYGEPAAAPEFWENTSPRAFFDRITEPVLIHHGTADDTCPIEWSYATLDALHDAGVDAELIEHDGEPHAFEAGWQTSIEQTRDFFNANIG